MATPKEERTVEIIVNGQKANASLKQLDGAAAVLYNQFRKVSADDPGRGKLLTDYQSMKERISAVRGELAGVSKAAGMMKQAFTNAFAIFTGGGIIGAVTKIFSFLSESRDRFQESVMASADLGATLKSTGHAAGLAAEEVKKIGSERAKVTLFNEDETNRASAMLLTFTNIKKGVFEDAIPAIQDLATKMGGDGPADLKTASIQVGKALNDPVNGITALKRVGVTFTEQQRDQVKAMVAVGNTAGAQKLILAELNKEFGGSAEAARKAGGGWATLQMQLHELEVQIGGKISEVLNALSGWLGRVIKDGQPLVDLVKSLWGEFASLFKEIGQVLEGMGLFTSKTDTAKMFVEALKVALTVLLMPLRMLLQLSKSVVEGFVDWYNKSELLRGILGGLGATVTSIFTTIKDDALHILGGVGDILVGIFTLDKDKLAKGLKEAFNATADLALEGGNKAADAFAKGYEANKNNRIAKASAEVEAPKEKKYDWSKFGDEAPAGESAKAKKAREAAEKKAQAARDKADKARLDSLKKWVAEEQATEDERIKAMTDKRQQEIAGINRDAKRKIDDMTGLEVNYTERVTLINQERDNRLKELNNKFAKEDAAAAKQALANKLAQFDADEVEQEAYLQEQFEDKKITQQSRDKQLWNLKLAAADAKLALIVSTEGKETAVYQKAYKERQKIEKDANKADLAEAKKQQEAKKAITRLTLDTATNALQTTLDLLFQDEAARKKNHNLYTALAGAKIIVDGVKEVQQIWEYSAAQPENDFTAGVFGTVLAAVQTGLAVARTGFALSQLQQFSFARGGSTGSGGGMAVSPVGQLLQMSGMAIGPDGKLTDGTGFAVAGVVHEDEYVIPKWQRRDPQVAAVEQWLEARRLRGFADGGPTTGSGAQLPVAAASPRSDGELTYAVQAQMLDVLREMSGRLAGVEKWQSELRVVNNLQDTRAGLDELKQVRQASAIRSKS